MKTMANKKLIAAGLLFLLAHLPIMAQGTKQFTLDDLMWGGSNYWNIQPRSVFTTWFTKYATTDLMWNNYLVEALCMVTNFVTEFLYDRFVVFRNSMNTNDVAKKDREKAEHKAQQENYKSV